MIIALEGFTPLNFGRKEKRSGKQHSYVVRVIVWLLAKSWSHGRCRGKALVKKNIYVSFSFCGHNLKTCQLSRQSFCLAPVEVFMVSKKVSQEAF